MKTCDFIAKCLHWCLKIVLTPIVLLGTPMIFLMYADEGCAAAKAEVKDFLRFWFTGKI